MIKNRLLYLVFAVLLYSPLVSVSAQDQLVQSTSPTTTDAEIRLNKWLNLEHQLQDVHAQFVTNNKNAIEGLETVKHEHEKLCRMKQQHAPVDEKISAQLSAFRRYNAEAEIIQKKNLTILWKIETGNLSPDVKLALLHQMNDNDKRIDYQHDIVWGNIRELAGDLKKIFLDDGMPSSMWPKSLELNRNDGKF